MNFFCFTSKIRRIEKGNFWSQWVKADKTNSMNYLLSLQVSRTTPPSCRANGRSHTHASPTDGPNFAPWVWNVVPLQMKKLTGDRVPLVALDLVRQQVTRKVLVSGVAPSTINQHDVTNHGRHVEKFRCGLAGRESLQYAPRVRGHVQGIEHFWRLDPLEKETLASEHQDSSSVRVEHGGVAYQTCKARWEVRMCAPRNTYFESAVIGGKDDFKCSFQIVFTPVGTSSI